MEGLRQGYLLLYFLLIVSSIWKEFCRLLQDCCEVQHLWGNTIFKSKWPITNQTLAKVLKRWYNPEKQNPKFVAKDCLCLTKCSQNPAHSSVFHFHSWLVYHKKTSKTKKTQQKQQQTPPQNPQKPSKTKKSPCSLGNYYSYFLNKCVLSRVFTQITTQYLSTIFSFKTSI